MTQRDIIVIGASAGGVEALIKLVSGLPAGLPAALFVVLHIPANSPSLLPAILSRSGPLPALSPEDNTPIKPGHIYIAPPDRHLLLEEDKIRIVRGPKENRHRPAVDPLFRSAARYYGSRVIGVILSGTLDDGTAGLLAVKRQGGYAIIQNPAEALYAGMPESARENVAIDEILPIAQIGKRLGELSQEQFDDPEEVAVPRGMELEVKLAQMDQDTLDSSERAGTPSAFSCPECGGVLWELQDGELLRFRCRVGHAFSTESIFAEQTDQIEEALWVALKTLEETVSLSQRMAEQARSRGQQWSTHHYEERRREARQRADLLRQVLTGLPSPNLAGEAGDTASQPESA